MESLLIKANDENMTLEMIYMDTQGELSYRVIKVVKNEEEFILGYCYDKKKVRSFRKDSILSIYPYKTRERKEA
ncbi:hypothetical protein [Halobacillus massiliensis]|uniref:hypothetical protein n=1 Tax=Halobacillus massiliensis TaxID=1926286 RepID=UPI0009E2AF5E|nr:hypothetical protein [Halobacillus massiliensis]